MLDLVLEMFWWVWIALLLIFSISFMIFLIFKDTDKDTDNSNDLNGSNDDSTARRNIILFRFIRR